MSLSHLRKARESVRDLLYREEALHTTFVLHFQRLIHIAVRIFYTPSVDAASKYTSASSLQLHRA